MSRHLAEEDMQVDNKHENLHSIMNHWRDADQKHNEILSYSLWDSYAKIEKIKIKHHATGCREIGIHVHC